MDFSRKRPLGCRSSREIHSISNSCRGSLRDIASFREARNFFVENYELCLCKMPLNYHSFSYLRCLKTLLENYSVEIKTRERKICIGMSATIVSTKYLTLIVSFYIQITGLENCTDLENREKSGKLKLVTEKARRKYKRDWNFELCSQFP